MKYVGYETNGDIVWITESPQLKNNPAVGRKEKLLDTSTVDELLDYRVNPTEDGFDRKPQTEIDTRIDNIKDAIADPNNFSPVLKAIVLGFQK